MGSRQFKSAKRNKTVPEGMTLHSIRKRDKVIGFMLCHMQHLQRKGTTTSFLPSNSSLPSLITQWPNNINRHIYIIRNLEGTGDEQNQPQRWSLVADKVMVWVPQYWSSSILKLTVITVPHSTMHLFYLRAIISRSIYIQQEESLYREKKNSTNNPPPR